MTIKRVSKPQKGRSLPRAINQETKAKRVRPSMPFCVNVYAIITPGSTVNTAVINNDVATANRIFTNCGVTIRLRGVFRITSESFRFRDKELSCRNLQQSQKAQNLIRIRPAGSTRLDIVVYYLGGDTFSDGVGRTVGCHTSRTGITGPSPSILLTNGISRPNSFILAHEIGHALFFNRTTGRSIDPSPNRDPNDPAHDLITSNFMNATVPRTNVTFHPAQCRGARLSELTRLCASGNKMNRKPVAKKSPPPTTSKRKGTGKSCGCK
ncbi:hypothetical protein QFZ77_001997 [Paenibacillus sp. V4I3]|uniref:hypothetical protein n=1 Tax=Paenibacillus sp. V4I3 TaxID=3042305 RepID=UPI00278372E7|nr:hypothetical protein [Paenibacillus sp. V4I3]MDQ0873338.1 hypothetical protein [Paenibacillus sp. V4I3]